MIACVWAGTPGYLAHGTATDYMYERLKVPLSFTWEIYGDADAHFYDCFRMFNPVSRDAFDQARPVACLQPQAWVWYVHPGNTGLQIESRAAALTAHPGEGTASEPQLC